MGHNTSKYDQEMPQLHITDQPMVPRGRGIRTQTNNDTYIKAGIQLKQCNRKKIIKQSKSNLVYVLVLLIQRRLLSYVQLCWYSLQSDNDQLITLLNFKLLMKEACLYHENYP